MLVDFVRFQASDGVELQGWLSDVQGDTAVLHIHGMSGNGYENRFLDNLRELYTKSGLSFFTIDTRGRGIVSSFWQSNKAGATKLGGSCFEIFEESIHDIQGALDFLRSKGKTKFILEGHSLGCTKVINYVITTAPDDVSKVILLAPTDMTGWANTEPKHQEYLLKAKQLLAEDQPEALVGAQCWLDKTPLSAQTYPSICEIGSSADIYGDREGGALLGRVQQPMLIVYGDADIGIEKIDGSINKWLECTNKILHENSKIAVIKDAPHSFAGHEEELAEEVKEFLD